MRQQAHSEDQVAPPSGMDTFRRRMVAARRALRKNPTMAFGFFIVILATLLAIFAPLVTVHDPTKLDVLNRLHAPTSDNWFGTDQLGRDVYARTMFGGRISILVGALVAAISVVGGIFFGLLAGYNKTLDKIIMRFADGLMSIPSILLAIALVAILGANVVNVVVAISIVQIPSTTRVVRSSVLGLREREFVEAARAIGVPPIRIMVVHIFPNTIAPLLVMGTLIFALAILTEAGLSFLGAGVPLETPSWGNIMGGGRNFTQQAFWIIFYPGLFLSFTVLGVNLIGDGLRDVLDPKISRQG